MLKAKNEPKFSERLELENAKKSIVLGMMRRKSKTTEEQGS